MAEKGGSKNDLMWVLAILAGLAILWFSSGGPTRSTSNRSPFLGSGINLTPRFSDSNSTNNDNSGNTAPADLARDIKIAQRDVLKLQSEIEKLQAEKERSPLYDKISISTANADEDYQKEYIKLSVSSSLKEKVLITGMSLYSPVTKKLVTIGGATPSPRVGEVNIESPLWANPGDTLYVNTISSPIGVSFRTNLCTGYLGQYQTFNPSIRKSCPRGDDEAVYLKTSLVTDEDCMDELGRISSCRVPSDFSKMGSLCQSFARANLNYNSCLVNHFKDTNFPGKEWYVYLKQTSNLWENDNDTIKLLDAERKTIDSVSY